MRETADGYVSTREPPAAQASIGQLLKAITRDTSALVRQEIGLAKAELRQEAQDAGKAAGMFAGAAIAAVMVLLFLSYAGWWGLANVMDQGWAALIVAGAWAVIGAILASMARRRARSLGGLPKTTQTVRRTPDALRRQHAATEEHR